MNLLKTIKKKIRGIGRRTGFMDDFDWSRYNEDEYLKQIHDLEKKYTFLLNDGKYAIVNGKIVLHTGHLPLNEHHQALYEAIYALRPSSVLEVGFGCGDHLANIKKLLPNVALRGLDLLPTQLAFLHRRHPDLKNQAQLFIQDMTVPFSQSMKADVAYTQAVLMHIQRYQPYLTALKNVFSLSNRHVVLAENWTRHNFFEDVKKISNDSDFPWKSVYYYIYDTGKQIAFIISAGPLTGFKEVKSNGELLTYYER